MGLFNMYGQAKDVFVMISSTHMILIIFFSSLVIAEQNSWCRYYPNDVDCIKNGAVYDGSLMPQSSTLPSPFEAILNITMDNLHVELSEISYKLSELIKNNTVDTQN